MQLYKISYKGQEYVGVVAGEVPFLSIKEATRFLGFKHQQYTRRLLLEGKLDGKVETVKGEEVYPLKAIRVKEKNFSKWYIAIPALVAYQAARQVRSAGRRYILRIDTSDLEKVNALLTKGKISYTLEPAYKPGKGKKPKVEDTPIEELESFTFG